MDGIEFDVHLSADGEVMVQHDYRINSDITRTTSGEWLERPTPYLCDLTSQELRAYDVGRYRNNCRLQSAYPDYIPRDNQVIPTLQQFLDALNARANSKCELWLELKTTPLDRSISSDPEQLLDAVLSKLDKSALLERTILLAFEWDVLLRAKQLAPSIHTDFLSLSTKVLKSNYPNSSEAEMNTIYGEYLPENYPGLPAAIAAAGGEWWGPLFGEVTQQDLVDARSHGLLVNAWGVGSTDKDINKALAMNFDAITLDRPDRARQLQ